jgi:hypothetical protein
LGSFKTWCGIEKELISKLHIKKQNPKSADFGVTWISNTSDLSSLSWSKKMALFVQKRL